jgi:putative SOS response-associated peptidase YedK
VSPIHDRMPVILPKHTYTKWVSSASDPKGLAPLHKLYPAEEMKTYPVSTFVNNAKHQGKECLEPVEANALF